MILKIFKLKCFDNGGKLFPVELSGLFYPKRIFWVTGVPRNAIRGKHAHRKCKQIYFCLAGKITITAVAHGKKEQKTLSPGDFCLIKERVWTSEKYLTGKDVLLVLASRPYEKEDYYKEE